MESFRIYVIYEGDDYKHIEKVVTYNLQPEYNIRNKTRKVSHRRVSKWASQAEYHRYYYHTDKGKEVIKKSNRKRLSRPCIYEGRNMNFGSLYLKFRSMGIENAAQEAKKYLV